MNAGDTFFVAQPYNHLYVVISDPALDSSKIVMVNFTTHTPLMKSRLASASRAITRSSSTRLLSDTKTLARLHQNRLMIL